MNRSIRAVPVSDEATAAASVNGQSPPTTEAKTQKKVGESFQQLAARLEIYRQAEALLEAGLRHVMEIGWSERESGGCCVLRSDGSQVPPSDSAVELATSQIHPALEAISTEIAAIEGNTTEKRVAYQAIVDETSSSHSPSRSSHAVESIGQYIDTLVRDAVKAELDRRTRFSRKSRKDAQTSE